MFLFFSEPIYVPREAQGTGSRKVAGGSKGDRHLCKDTSVSTLDPLTPFLGLNLEDTRCCQGLLPCLLPYAPKCFLSGAILKEFQFVDLTNLPTERTNTLHTVFRLCVFPPQGTRRA